MACNYADIKCSAHNCKASLVCSHKNCSKILCLNCLKVHDNSHMQSLVPLEDLFGSPAKQSILIEQIDKLISENTSNNSSTDNHQKHTTKQLNNIFQEIYSFIKKKLEKKRLSLLNKLQGNKNFNVNTELNSLKSSVQRILTQTPSDTAVSELIRKYQKIFYKITPKLNKTSENSNKIIDSNVPPIILPQHFNSSLENHLKQILNLLDTIIEDQPLKQPLDLSKSQQVQKCSVDINTKIPDLNEKDFQQKSTPKVTTPCLKNLDSVFNKQIKKVSVCGNLNTNFLLINQTRLHNMPIHYIQFGNNRDKQTYICGSDSYINIVDIALEKKIKNLQMKTLMWCFSGLDDIQVFAIAGQEGIIGIWRDFNQLILSIEAHNSDIYSLAYIDDKKWIVSGSKDKMIKLWNIQNGQLIAQLEGHTEAVMSITTVKKKDLIVSGSDKGILKLWNLQNMLNIKTIEAHQGSIKYLLYVDEGERLFSGGDDRIIKIWSVKDLKLIQTLTGHEHSITGFIYSKTQQKLISSSKDGIIRLWNAPNFESHGFFKCINGITALHYKSSTKSLVTGDEMGNLSLYKYTE